MNDYGRGGTALGAASLLPATSAIALWAYQRTNKFIIIALLILSLLNLIVNLAMVVRYSVNTKK